MRAEVTLESAYRPAGGRSRSYSEQTALISAQASTCDAQEKPTPAWRPCGGLVLIVPNTADVDAPTQVGPSLVVLTAGQLNDDQDDILLNPDASGRAILDGRRTAIGLLPANADGATIREMRNAIERIRIYIDDCRLAQCSAEQWSANRPLPKLWHSAKELQTWLLCLRESNPDDQQREPFRFTDVGNGERLVYSHGADLRYVHAWNKWLVWDGKRWAPDDRAEAIRFAKQTIRELYRQAADCEGDSERKTLASWAKTSETRTRIEAMLWSAASEKGIGIKPGDLDRDPMLLAVQNGTLDLRTGDLREHRREDLISRISPIEFDPHRGCPLWLSTLNKIFNGNRELIGYWQRLCGLALTASVSEQILPILHGSGANGKSTVLTVLLEILGPELACKAPPSLLLMKKNEAHPTEFTVLYGRRLVVAVESAEGARLNETLVKELTGSDRISARRMREDFWEFDPTHKIMMATNHRPTIRGTDHAIWRRVQLIPFEVRIPDHEQDKKLLTKLRREMPGILAWAVEGCLAWQRNGLGTPDVVQSASKSYRDEQDVLASFLEHECVIDAGTQVKASLLYSRYQEWCQRTGEYKVNQRRFGGAMTERGFERDKSGVISYKGIRLREID